MARYWDSVSDSMSLNEYIVEILVPKVVLGAGICSLAWAEARARSTGGGVERDSLKPKSLR